MSSEPLVVVENLEVTYRQTVAVQGLSFTIPRGEIYGFIGPNGAGKTSTIKVLATLLKPSAGTAQIAGFDVRRRAQEVRRKIGYMPDFFGVYEDLTVREYLHFFAAAYRLEIPRRPALVADVLALTDLTEKADATVDALSRGLKQRLGVARLLLHDPELLLLDEPASGLDPRARIEMRELLKELQALGKTILISSHILHELAQFCTHIGIIEAGRMIVSGSLAEIYAAIGLRRIVHVQLANPSTLLAEKIRMIPGVAHLEEQTDRYAIQISEHQLALEDLMDALHALGARVRMFQPDALDMETAFMKLTEGKLA
jgi:ABC-2 type transport system ATP-binding protein